jgi:hypothetical protein
MHQRGAEIQEDMSPQCAGLVCDGGLWLPWPLRCRYQAAQLTSRPATAVHSRVVAPIASVAPQ